MGKNWTWMKRRFDGEKHAKHMWDLTEKTSSSFYLHNSGHDGNDGRFFFSIKDGDLSIFHSDSTIKQGTIS